MAVLKLKLQNRKLKRWKKNLKLKLKQKILKTSTVQKK